MKNLLHYLLPKKEGCTGVSPVIVTILEGDALPCSTPARCALRAIFDVLPCHPLMSRLSAPKPQARCTALKERAGRPLSFTLPSKPRQLRSQPFSFSL
jgi:hypothetical protein